MLGDRQRFRVARRTLVSSSHDLNCKPRNGHGVLAADGMESFFLLAAVVGCGIIEGVAVRRQRPDCAACKHDSTGRGAVSVARSNVSSRPRGTSSYRGWDRQPHDHRAVCMRPQRRPITDGGCLVQHARRHIEGTSDLRRYQSGLARAFGSRGRYEGDRSGSHAGEAHATDRGPRKTGSVFDHDGVWRTVPGHSRAPARRLAPRRSQRPTDRTGPPDS